MHDGAPRANAVKNNLSPFPLSASGEGGRGPRRAEAMASSGHRRVRDHFLVLSQIRRWLEELDALLQPRVAAAPAQVALGPP
jgi:hypothetical protein